MLGSIIIVFTGIMLFTFIRPPVTTTKQIKQPALNHLYRLAEGSVNTAEAKING